MEGLFKGFIVFEEGFFEYVGFWVPNIEVVFFCVVLIWLEKEAFLLTGV